MDIYYLGQSCFKIKGKNAAVVIDPYDSEFTGLKLPKDLSADVVLSTHNHQDHNFVSAVAGSPLIIVSPGEYEKSRISITGIKTYHDKQQGQERGNNTIYRINLDGMNLLHLGDLGDILTEEQLSLIDDIDILMIPVGGLSTIDAEDAVKVVSQIEPKIVIPMHYKTEGLKFELGGIEPFLKEMGAENSIPQPKLSITLDKLPETTTVVVLNKS